MALNDPLANALSLIKNAEKVGKTELVIKPISKVIRTVLKIMNEHGYVGALEEKEDGKGNYFVLPLLGAINDCGVIKPRRAISVNDVEKNEKRYLPGKGFGIVLISTSQGIMTVAEAKEKHIGGKLISYCY